MAMDRSRSPLMRPGGQSSGMNAWRGDGAQSMGVAQSKFITPLAPAPLRPAPGSNPSMLLGNGANGMVGPESWQPAASTAKGGPPFPISPQQPGMQNGMGTSSGLGACMGSSPSTSLGPNFGANLGSNLGSGMNAGLGSNLGANAGYGLGSSVGSNLLGSGLGTSASSNLGPNLGSSLNSGVGASLGSGAMGSSLGSNLGTGLGLGTGFGGSGLNSGMSSNLGAGLNSGMGSNLGSGLGPGIGSGMNSGMGPGMGPGIGNGMGSGMMQGGPGGGGLMRPTGLGPNMGNMQNMHGMQNMMPQNGMQSSGSTMMQPMMRGKGLLQPANMMQQQQNQGMMQQTMMQPNGMQPGQGFLNTSGAQGMQGMRGPGLGHFGPGVGLNNMGMGARGMMPGYGTQGPQMTHPKGGLMTAPGMMVGGRPGTPPPPPPADPADEKRLRLRELRRQYAQLDLAIPAGILEWSIPDLEQYFRSGGTVRPGNGRMEPTAGVGVPLPKAAAPAPAAPAAGKSSPSDGKPPPPPEPEAKAELKPLTPMKRPLDCSTSDQEYAVTEAVDILAHLEKHFSEEAFQDGMKQLHARFPNRKQRGHADGPAYFEAFEAATLATYSKVLPSVGLEADWEGVRELNRRMRKAMDNEKVKGMHEEINVLMGLPRDAIFMPQREREEMFIYRPNHDAEVVGPARPMVVDEDGDEGHEFLVEDAPSGELQLRGVSALETACWYVVLQKPAVRILAKPDVKADAVGRKKAGKKIRVSRVLDNKWLQLHSSEVLKYGAHEAWVLLDGTLMGLDQKCLEKVP